MPSRRQHIAKAEHNELASLSFETGDFADWAVTALFYATLHWLDAYLAGTNTHPPTHSVRRQLLITDSQLTPIYRSYRLLKDRSEDARYRGHPFAMADVQKLRQQHAEPVKRHLRGLLGI